MLTSQLAAQTLTSLYSFTALNGSTNNDGANPIAGLVLSGNTLYGMAEFGGANGHGTVFAVNTDGSDFTNLHTFTGSSDGATPVGGLTLSGHTLYGTTYYGGKSNNGTVFVVNTDGTGFTNIYSFTGGNGGAKPFAKLILSGNTLFGTTQYGGTWGNGTVFAINTDGTGFTNLYNFTGGNAGANPVGGIVLSSNMLYGTTQNGGISNYGTVFAVNTNGTGFANLISFTGSQNGAYPVGGLILSGNTLYGTAQLGSTKGFGTVFAIHTDGTGFTNLYNFANRNDGGQPQSELILSGNTLYGTAAYRWLTNVGTVFAVNTDGTDFRTLHSFTGGSDGAYPWAGLILSGDMLYGTTFSGGTWTNGTVFRLFNPPQLAITLSGANVILTWSTNATGFTLQSTTNLNSSAVWSAVSPAPVVVNSLNTVTNRISAAQMFYRLVLSPPQLAITLSGANVILTWPTNTAGFTLQSTTNLNLPVTWSAVSPAPVVVNSLNTVTNPISAPRMFYRLSQ